MLSEFAGYKNLRLLREGNFGTFYAAEPPERLQNAGREVTLKVMFGSASDDEFRRFANELKVFASLKSPYLAGLLEAGNVGGTLYYVMEAFPGGSLERPTGEPSLAEKARSVASAARGADDLHNGGIVHRDIKPANVLLSENGAKLTDLGLAHIITPGQTFTGNGPIGTVEFMDPALIRGDGGSRATDIWSLGVTLHWVLSGHGIYGRIPTNSIIDALRHVITTPAMLDPEIPAVWRGVLETSLATDPASRFPTAAAMAGAIEEVATKA